MFRSTKGASKQRRDLINAEITNLRDILPLSESARQRLSQLQIMSLACCYIRKCNYFTRLFGNVGYSPDNPFEFSQAMTGFLLIATREGKLLYISENITEYLGHSMVDMMTQGDSIYDIIDKRDHSSVQTQLLQTNFNPGGIDERTFFCRMNVSRSFRRQAGFGDHKVMHVRGHFIQPVIRDHYGNQPVFMAMCSPLITPDVKETVVHNNTTMFHTVHSLDMKYIEIGNNAEFYLGYSDFEIFGRSWYELLHPEDIHEAKEKHNQLIKSSHEMGCMLTVRVQSKYGDWVWLNMVMHIRQPFVSDKGEAAIVCINHVIRDSEAQLFKLQSQLYSSHIARSPEYCPQGISPPHTITPVPVEHDTLRLHQHYGAEDSTAAYYQGNFGVTIAPINPAGTVAPSGSSTEHGQVHSPRGSLQGYDSGTEYSAAMDHPITAQRMNAAKDQIRADILTRMSQRLKRDRKPEPTDLCKPAKIARTSEHSEGSHNGNGMVIHGTAFITRTFGGAVEDSYGSGGGTQVISQAHYQPILQSLSLKKELPDMMHEIQKECHTSGITILDNVHHPPTPLTPDSMSCDSPPSMTNLTIQVNDIGQVPATLDMLTPEPSPRSPPSERLAFSPASQEQCVPTMLADLDESLSLPDTDSVHSIHSPRAPPKVCKVAETPLQMLPILDIMTLENFLTACEVGPNKKGVEVKQEKGQAEVMDLDKVQVKEESDLVEPDALLALPGLQLNSMMNSVTDTLFELIQESMPLGTNLHGEFMLIPGQAESEEPRRADLLTGVPSVESDASMSPSARDDEDFLDELHQLSELADSMPSYGARSLSGAVFDENL